MCWLGRRPADYLLLTDADIAYAPETVTGLVARGRGRRARPHSLHGQAELRRAGGARA